MIGLFLTSSKYIFEIDCANVISYDILHKINLSYRIDRLQDPTRLKVDMEVLLIYCDWIKKKNVYIYHPIRKAKIYDVKNTNSHCLVTVVLTKPIKYFSEPEKNAKYIKDFNNQFKNNDTHPNGTKRKFVINNVAGPFYWDNDFYNLFYHFGNIDFYNDYIFFKSVDKSLRNSPNILTLKNSFLGKEVNLLKINEVYEITFYTYSKIGKDHPKLFHDKEMGVLIGPIANQFHSGAYVSYLLFTNEIKKNYTLVAKLNSDNGKVLGPYYIQHIQLKGKNWKKIGAIAAITFGILIGDLTNDIHQSLCISKELIIASSGLLLFGGLYYLSNKLNFNF
jgi:hypothetical protein